MSLNLIKMIFTNFMETKNFFIQIFRILTKHPKIKENFKFFLMLYGIIINLCFQDCK